MASPEDVGRMNLTGKLTEKLTERLTRSLLGASGGGAPPIPSGTYILAESGDNLITEDSNKLITE